MDRSTRVLAVDRDRLIRLNVELALERGGHVVDVAATGGEALALLKANRYGLVVMSSELLEGPCAEIVAAARAIQPDIRVLLLCPSPDEICEAVAHDVAPDAVLCKPFRLAQLVDEARRLTGAREKPVAALHARDRAPEAS
jgi:DNA-binding response OmpR family regulator